MFDWGDGNSTGWIGPYSSGEKIKAYHIWKENGTFEIKVKAKDINGSKSQWSDSLRLIVHKRIETEKQILMRSLNIFPSLKRLFYLFL